MKKDYVKPTVASMKLNCEGMLCTSAFDEGETDNTGVYNKPTDGPAL